MDQLLDQLIIYIRAIWHRRLIAMVTIWVTCIVGWIILGALPDIYEARTRVFVDTTSEISRLLDDRILDPNIQQELLYVRQSMLGRIQLEKVARKTDLLFDSETDDDVQAVIDHLAESVEIEGTGGRRGVGDNLFTITYRNKDPRLAEEVVSTVLNIFIEDTLGGRTNSSKISQQFLEQQIADYERRLQASEQRLAEFKRVNYDRLPDQKGGYFNRLQLETAELENSIQQLAQLTAKRDRLVKQLEGELPKALETGELNPDSIGGRLQASRIRRDELLLQFTQNHPDVIAINQAILRLEKQLEEEIEARIEEGTVPSASNPVYQALQIAINEVEGEIAILEVELEGNAQKVSDLKDRINEISDVEAQFSRLNRDYDIIQLQYQALVDSLERERLTREASLSEEVEFRIIDPPLVNQEPVAPSRIAIVPAILAFSVFAGIGLALLISQLKPVIQSERAAQLIPGVNVIGSISWSAGLSARSAAHSLRIYLVSGLCLLLVFSFVMAIEGLGPGFRAFFM